MTDFAHSWQLSRSRLRETVADLNQEQLNWQLHQDALTIGEAVVHVAGVELWFVKQLTGETYNGEYDRVMASATAGVVNSDPFPFTADELTLEFVLSVFDFAEGIVRPFIEDPSEEFLAKEIKSALGPMITGKGALTRFAFHPAYHQGQAYMMRTSPDFPA